MKAIFLDIDGVLNTQADWSKMYTLNPLCMSEFMAYAKRCMPVAVVLTSSWRKGYDGFESEKNSEPIQRLIDAFREKDIRVWGKTPDLGGRRATEIERYLDLYPEITEYIILDDNPEEFDKEIPGCFFVNPKRGFVYNRKMKFVKR